MNQWCSRFVRCTPFFRGDATRHHGPHRRLDREKSRALRRLVPSGDERLSPYLVAAARAVALSAPRVPGRADCGLRSVVQSVTPQRRSYSPAIVRDRARDGCEVDCGGFGSVLATGSPSRSTRRRTRRQIGEQLAGKAPRSGRCRTPPNPRPGRRIHRLGHGQNVGTLSITRKQRCATYQHACERFSGVSDERPAPPPRCAAGTGGSRADRRTTRPACRSARRPCPSVHPAAQWCALRRRPTDGRR